MMNGEQDVLTLLSSKFGATPSHSIKQRPDGDFLILEFAEPSERLFRQIEDVNASLNSDNIFKDRLSVIRRARKPADVIDLPETQMLQRELSECLTVDRSTFGAEFFSRYTASVTNFEQRIVDRANFIVYGRRGSGKSSLLAYAMNALRRDGFSFAWVALQTYSGRGDYSVVAAVLSEIVRELSPISKNPNAYLEVADELLKVAERGAKEAESEIKRVTPRLRAMLGSLGTPGKPVTIFLDDLHVIDQAFQPTLLGALYSLSRGNNVFLKASGIEQFTLPWDSVKRVGLEPPHDTQILKLDHNLTMPDRSKEHIVGILDAHARYCGLPGIGYIADDGVISRLVLAAAAVPRDALSLLSQAITRSAVKRQKSVSITSVNSAASEAIEEKLKDIERDSHQNENVNGCLSAVREFCLNDRQKNAFLVRIRNESARYKQIQQLVALRLVHVLHEGITPNRAGKRYIALMLDYGFYIGIRAATSVKLYPEEPRSLSAKELRRLPILNLESEPSSRNRRP